jgi:hypothetical protein
MTLRAFGLLIAFAPLILPPSFTSAAIYSPGDSVPGVTGDVFTWSRGDANSTYSGWDRFEAVLPSDDPQVTLPPPGSYTDSTPDLPGQFGTPSSITVSAGGIRVGSGNAYSPFAPLSFNATINSGTAGGDFTRIVAQIRSIGTEMDYSSILLSTDTLSSGNVAPSLMLETGRAPFGGFGGGDIVDYLAMWDLNSSQEAYRIDFNSASSSFSLDQFNVDTFTQSTAFVTPTAIPEPGAVALLGLLSGGVLLRRRRRRSGPVV